MKIANSELLHGPFVHPEQAFRRVRKIMQNYAKMHKNHRKISTKETNYDLAMAKNTPHRLTCQNASKCDRFCCSRSCIALEKCADIT